MNRFILATATFIAAVPLLAKPPEGTKLALEIQKATKTKFGYEVSVRVKNVSGADLVLGRTGAAPSKLQSLDVQQWDENLGWQSVGPCRDVGPIGVLTMAPQQQLDDVIPIGDLEHGWSSSVCPRKIKRLGGRIRAVFSCVYKSEKQYEERLRCRDCCILTTSPDFQLPPLTLVSAQVSQFIGIWQQPHWKKGNRGVVLRIFQGAHGLEGTIHFWDPGADHESTMLNPKVEGNAFVFDVDDDYVKRKLSFSMTVNKSGTVAALSGHGGELLIDFTLNKVP